MTADLKPIRNEADYDAALEEVGRLWGAKSGTPDGDKLDVLATLLAANVAPHHQIVSTDLVPYTNATPPTSSME